MSNITHTTVNYKPLTKDGLVMKKLLAEGFGVCPGKGMECVVNFYSETEDGRFLDNTNVIREPYVITIGKLSVIPGLEIGLKSMQMGEKAVLRIAPEYSFLAQERFKDCDKSLLENLKNEAFKTEVQNTHTPEELLKMEVADAKKYQNVYYEIELIKFDKPRPKKVTLSPNERMEQATELKTEGNELFKEKRYREAIVKYKDGHQYLSQMPTQFLTDEYRDLQNSLTLNITNCHIKLLEYTYGLKNLEENFCFKHTPKVFYFKAICQMHLGDFDEALLNLNDLAKVLPDDQLTKKIFEDYYALRKKTLSKQKENYKKGLFQAGLYSEKKDINTNELTLPSFDGRNVCFFVDFLENGDVANPKKIKIEILQNTKENIPQLFTYLENVIKNHAYTNKEIKFNFETENSLTIEGGIALPELKNFSEVNKYSTAEDSLLILEKKGETFELKLSAEALSDKLIENLAVVGRCYFNKEAVVSLKKEKKSGVLKITDIGYTYNI